MKIANAFQMAVLEADILVIEVAPDAAEDCAELNTVESSTTAGTVGAMLGVLSAARSWGLSLPVLVGGSDPCSHDEIGSSSGFSGISQVHVWSTAEPEPTSTYSIVSSCRAQYNIGAPVSTSRLANPQYGHSICPGKSGLQKHGNASGGPSQRVVKRSPYDSP